MSVSFDAAVIGGGPAGCTAAHGLARRGARVAIVDGSHPREKACGGGVTGRALDLLSKEAVRTVAGGQPIDRAVFEVDDRRAAFRLDEPIMRVFARESFDRTLLDAAIEAGSTFVPSRATAIERDAGGWIVRTSAGRIRARWLVGADGPSGIVRKQVFRPFQRSQLSIAAGSFVDAADVSEIVVRFVDSPPGYLWSFPRRDHLAVGVCAQADEGTPGDLHKAADRWLDAYAAARGRSRRRYAWPIPSLGTADLDQERPAGNRWMLAGDAAGLVDPITREGIFFAVQSGAAAAASLSNHDPAREYADSVRDEIHAELKRAARLRAAFFQPRFTRLLIDALNASADIRRVMIDLIAGRQPYATLKRALLETLEVRFMWRLLTS
jgi:geranylgeranyl reductase family protein